MSSKREQIVANVVTTLAAVAKANGYNYDLAGKVSRVLKHWQECGEYPQVFVVDGTERKEYGNNVMVECFLEVIVRGYEHDAEDASAKINNLLQDVEKALCVDHTRGGSAVNTAPVSVQTDEGWLAPYGIFEYRFEILYQYEYGSP